MQRMLQCFPHRRHVHGYSNHRLCLQSPEYRCHWNEQALQDMAKGGKMKLIIGGGKVTDSARYCSYGRDKNQVNR